jgi:predicted enzyme related to lactoylglutathione lyase
MFGWEEVPSEPGPVASYRMFSAGGDTIGGMFNKLPRVPMPFWVYYFNVADLDRAMASVQAGGGRVVHGPTDLPGGASIARCVDPQGAMFALRGPRGKSGEAAAGETTELGFSAAWGDFASRGRVVADRKKAGMPAPKSPQKPKR